MKIWKHGEKLTKGETMPRYTVDLSVTITLSVDVEAEDEEHAESNWSSYEHALMEAKLAVAETARCLDDYEFDVENVTAIEEDDNE